MNIGFIGAGRIASTLARHFINAGHSVALSNSQGPETLTSLATSLGPKAQAMTAENAVKFGEIVIIAIPWGAHTSLPASHLFAGKIVVDAMNAYPISDQVSSEETARQLPEARVVKAFNTLNFELLGKRATNNASKRLSLFVAGDDAAAKKVIEQLIDQIGFAAVDTGSLHVGGKRQQPGSPIYNVPLTATEAEKLLSTP